jgi:uncharacterized protein (TIGR03083 family)
MDIRHTPDRTELVSIWQDTLLSIADLVDQASPEQWSSPTPCPGWSVGDVIAHVIDIEQVLGQEPRPDHAPDFAALPHATGDVGRFTEVGVDWRRGRAPKDVVGELRETIVRRRAQLDAVPIGGEVLSPFGRPTSMERLLSMRILDTWVHEQDIRAALDRPGGMETPGAIVTLQQFLSGLPKVWAKQAKAPEGATIHLVIADAGRGTEAWAVAGADGVGETCTPVDEPTVEVTMTWQDYLALSAGREDPPVVLRRVAVRGDGELGERMLAAMTQTP